MTESAIPVQRWTETVTSAMSEVAASSLGCETSLEGIEIASPVSLCGSLVALVSGRNVVCVGFSSTPDGCRKIAGAMLGLEGDDIDGLSHDDVRDSVGELVNILAGAVKTKLSSEDADLTLGLPIYFEGFFEGDSHSRSTYVPCRVGETTGVITLLLAAGSTRAAA